MRPGQYDHVFTAGDDYELTVTLTLGGQLVDTNGWIFRAEIREGYLPHGTLREAFQVEVIAGGCKLSLDAGQTRALQGFSRLVWDLQSEAPETRTWLTGSINLTPDVTNDGGVS
jgi:hypothetical protein